MRYHLTNFDGGDAGVPESTGERAGILGGNRDQQASGGLRVEEKRADVGGNRRIVVNQVFGKVAIGYESAGNVAGADAIERAFEQGNVGGFEYEADVRGKCHFAGVADQAETGDVGKGVDGEGASRTARFRLDGRDARRSTGFG